MSEVLVQYQSHPLASGAVCEACGSADMLVRDHCHEHGWIRGIACRGCNAHLSRIDRGKTPRVPKDHLVALLALRNRCRDCVQLDVSDLEPPRERVQPRKEVPRTSKDARARIGRLRGKAARQGYELRKTRRIDPDARDYGTYTLTPEKGKPRTFASIDEVEAFLFREESPTA